MDAESTEALIERVSAAPDVETRARLLRVDLRAVAATHRHLVVSIWSLAIVLAAAILLSRTLRIGLVAGHGQWDPWIRPYLGVAAAGVLATVLVVWGLLGIVQGLAHLIAHRLSQHPRWALLMGALMTAAVLPAVGVVSSLLVSDPTFLLGVVAGTPIAIAVVRYPLDIARRMRENNRGVIRFLASQVDLEHRAALVDSRLRWPLVELSTSVVGATAMMLLIVVVPWTAIPLVVTDVAVALVVFATQASGRGRIGRMIDLAATLVLVAVALVIAGGFLVPTISFGNMPLPA